MSIRKEIRLECRPTSNDEWKVLNRGFFTEGSTPTEKRERENVQHEMQARLSQWPQRYEAYATHQFRLVTE